MKPKPKTRLCSDLRVAARRLNLSADELRRRCEHLDIENSHYIGHAFGDAYVVSDYTVDVELARRAANNSGTAP